MRWKRRRRLPKLEVPETTYEGVTLAGGWCVEVPEVRVVASSPRMRTLVRRLMRGGAKPLDAERFAERAVVDFFEREWRARTMKLVGRWAKMYADQNFGSLEGFVPEVVADTWIPGNARVRWTEAEVKMLFAAMRRDENSRR